jgi:hypothetical protein
MWILTFYRFYLSVASGIAVCIFLRQSVWIGILTCIVVRSGWFAIEHVLRDRQVRRDFKRHIQEFKQLYGPYGIRIANKAENDRRIRNSLVEVFTADQTKLKKAVETLEVMDAMFRAGMRPDADEYLLHDLKLKYGKKRMEKNGA